MLRDIWIKPTLAAMHVANRVRNALSLGILEHIALGPGQRDGAHIVLIIGLRQRNDLDGRMVERQLLRGADAALRIMTRHAQVHQNHIWFALRHALQHLFG